MKRILFLSLLVLLITSCGKVNSDLQKLDETDTNKATAKVDTTPSSPNTSSSESPPNPTTSSSSSPDNVWTVYDNYNATWLDDFQGMKTQIQLVGVSDKIDLGDGIKSAVIVKFRLENITTGIFTTYPDQARLVTSTGEQLDSPDMLKSDNIGGEIEEGVIKEGLVVWFLERGHAEDITWVKIKWDIYKDDIMDRKEYDVKLNLK